MAHTARPHEAMTPLCPQCKVRAELAKVLFRADGFVRSESVCPKCNSVVGFESDMAMIIVRCTLRDLQKPETIEAKALRELADAPTKGVN